MARWPIISKYCTRGPAEAAGSVSSGAQRASGHGHLLETAVDGGRLDAHHVVDGGDDVAHVVELVAHRTGVVDHRRPVDDHGHVDAALVGVLLVPLERRVAGLGPSPRVVGVAVGPADVVEAADGLVGRLHQEVEELHLVQHAERSALLAGPVVRQQEDQGVVELAERVELVDQPADLVVGVVQEGGEGLLQAGGQPLVGVGHLVPGLDPGVARRQLGVGRDQPQLELAGEPPVAGGVPSFVVAPAVLVQVGRRGLVGRVGGAEGQVHEVGPVGPDRRGVVHEPDGVVDQVLAEVVALVGPGGGLDGVVVVDQLGVELVGLAVEEAVEAVEARAGTATGRRARRPTRSPSGTGATCPGRRWCSPGRAAPRPRWRRGWRCGRACGGSPCRSWPPSACPRCGGCARSAGRPGWASTTA